MSFIDPLSVLTVASSVDITGLTEDAAKALAPDVEYRLREIVQEALKFARHSKRTRLTADDITNALILRNVEPIYGFMHKDPGKFARAAGHSDVFFVQDRELTFEQVIEASLPKAPIEVGVKPHWLVIEGVQPVIPENAPLEGGPIKRRKLQHPPAAGHAAVQTTTTGQAADASHPASRGGDATAFGPAVLAGMAARGGASGAEAGVKLPVKHLLSLELQVYFTKMCQLLRGELLGPGPWAVSTGEVLEAPPQEQQPAAALGQDAESPEQRRQLKAALASLATDPGLQQLAPYLSQFIAAEVGKSLKSLQPLSRLLQAIGALLSNPHVNLEPYLAQLLPPILTCMVAKNLGGPGDDHWTLRDQAARLAAAVCTRFSEPVYNIQPRVLRTLLSALLDASKPLPVQYGAIRGLAAMGPRVVTLLLLPNLEPFVLKLAGQPPKPPPQSHAPSQPPSAAAAEASLGSGEAAPGTARPPPEDGTASEAAAAPQLPSSKPQPPVVVTSAKLAAARPAAQAAKDEASASKEAVQPPLQSSDPLQQYQAWRCWGALVEAVGASAYHRVVSAAAAQLPDHLLRPSDGPHPSHAAEEDDRTPTAPDTGMGPGSHPGAGGAANGLARQTTPQAGQATAGQATPAAMDVDPAAVGGEATAAPATVTPAAAVLPANAEAAGPSGMEVDGTPRSSKPPAANAPVILARANPDRRAAPGTARPSAGSASRGPGRPRPVRAVLADAWREDADLGEQLEALAELLGEPMLAMLPSSMLSSHFL